MPSESWAFEISCLKANSCMPGTSGLSDVQKSWANAQTSLFLYQQILWEKKYSRQTYGLLLSCSFFLVIEGLCLLCKLPRSAMWYSEVLCSMSLQWHGPVSKVGHRLTNSRKWIIGLVVQFFDASSCLVMENLQVLWSANSPSLPADLVTVVSEFREHAEKLNYLLQIKVQT